METVLKGTVYYDILADEKSKTFVTQVQATGPDYNDTIHQEMERIYVYVADELGFLKLWDLTSIIQSFNLEKCQCIPQQKAAFNPRRQEIIDNSHSAS